MKKILISGYIGFNNFGDELIFKMLKEHLKNLNYNISALSKTDNYDIKTYKYKNPFEIIKAVLNCDILVSGGGSLLQNKTSNFSLIYYLSIILLAKLFFKKVIIFAQGFEPIKGNFYEYLTKKILKMCDFISVRDTLSQKYLAGLKINSVLLSDPAFSIYQKPCQKKEGVIIQLRKTKYTDDKFIEKLAISIIKFQKNIDVLALQEQYDREICCKFINEFNKLGGKAEYIYNENIEKTIDIINKCKYLISTRLHGLITASVLSTNTFALSYDDKTDSLCSELNIQKVNIKNIDFNVLDEKLKVFFESPSKQKPYRPFDWSEIDNILRSL